MSKIFNVDFSGLERIRFAKLRARTSFGALPAHSPSA